MKTHISLVLISAAIVLYGAACGTITTAPVAQPATAAASTEISHGSGGTHTHDPADGNSRGIGLGYSHRAQEVQHA